MITKKAGISEITIWLRERHFSVFYSLIIEDYLYVEQDRMKVYVSFHRETIGKESKKYSSLIKMRATKSQEIIVLQREKPLIHDKS